MEVEIEQDRDEPRSGGVEGVAVDLAHGFGGQGLLRLEQLDDAGGAEAQIGHRRQQVGIGGVDGAIVGRDDEAGRRIVGGGKVLEGNGAGPFAAVGPSRHREGPVAAAADWHAAGHLVADVAVDVGVNEILRRHVPVAQGGAEFVEVLRPVDVEGGAQYGRGLERRPAQADGHRGALGDGRPLGQRLQFFVGVGEHRPVACLAHADRHRGPTGDEEHLLAGVHRLPLAVDVVQVGVVRVDPFQVKVLHVRPGIGHAPGDAVVVADDDRRQADEGEPDDIQAAGLVDRRAVQPVLVPDRRHANPQVHVVGQDRHPAARTRARHDPIVGPESAQAAAGHTIQPFDAGQDQPQRVAGGGVVC